MPARNETGRAPAGRVNTSSGRPLDRHTHRRTCQHFRHRRLAARVTAAPDAEHVTTTAPHTGDPLADLPVATPADVDAAFARARDAQTAWAATSVGDREKILLRFAPQRRRGAIPVLNHTTEPRHPKGVVVVVSPWNYPLSMAAGDAIPALMAGNAVVRKPLPSNASKDFTPPKGISHRHWASVLRILKAARTR
ncbi:hypothetical protein GCM10017786_13640 [Amycolatopsis deserti]|uniref:Aldehyde dehydrogenase domain-containing protein n=1 Tax=Amycolatopsis deserti TaxID=185696 RepID=A0ABQ3IHE1_9PSEU|nr:aldehyde dehydrogenase family protein [Amycolatopsis deserti]GHE83707.1 hypothetical protein GCM10017786_13640 [Amycolatopsis deserti]